VEVAGEAAWIPVRHISGRRPTSLLATSRIFSLGNQFLRLLIDLLQYVPFGPRHLVHPCIVLVIIQPPQLVMVTIRLLFT
jgi:hypothetical protein